MSDIAIRVESLGKKYTLRHQKRERYVTLRDLLTKQTQQLGRALFSPRKKSGVSSTQEIFWALQDVSFEVKRGDRVGIIGRNGAGKSTLLKILSRITEPSQGRISIKGRVASLLEVGTGFHPELTGRENIYLNGAILGMERAEIRRKFDEIVAFAEVERFLDTPVKRYSSGMYVRLAFSVAAHLEPEILIIDEVLAVGDVAFQKKCLGKMGEIASSDKTVLFVSHQMGAIKTLCNQSILLAQGHIQAQGNTATILEQYLHSVAEDIQSSQICWANPQEAPGGEEIRLCSVQLRDSRGNVRSSFSSDEEIYIEIIYNLYIPIPGMRVTIRVHNSEGTMLFFGSDYQERSQWGNEEQSQRGIFRNICVIPANLLNSGFYCIKIGSDYPGIRHLLHPVELLSFSIERASYEPFFPASVEIAPSLRWEVRLIESVPTALISD